MGKSLKKRTTGLCETTTWHVSCTEVKLNTKAIRVNALPNYKHAQQLTGTRGYVNDAEAYFGVYAQLI